MLIVMSHKAGTKQIESVTRAIEAMGLTAAPIPGSERTAIGVLGNKGYVDDTTIRDLPGVSQVIHVSKPYKLVSRDFHPKNTIVKVGGVEIGEGKRPVVVAGPCAVESEVQILKTARAVKKRGLTCSAAALSNRGPDPILFRRWEKKGSGCWSWPARRPDCR